jgi:hypothetical protein
LQLGPYQFDPYLGNVLGANDTVNVFYFVMNPAGDAEGNPKLSIQYELKDAEGELLKRFNLPEVATSVIGHPMDFKELKLKPGKYDLSIQIKDTIGGSTLNKAIPLVIQ